jgi:hypothetical protein
VIARDEGTGKRRKLRERTEDPLMQVVASIVAFLIIVATVLPFGHPAITTEKVDSAHTRSVGLAARGPYSSAKAVWVAGGIVIVVISGFWTWSTKTRDKRTNITAWRSALCARC